MEGSFGSGSSARPMMVSAVSDDQGEFELRGLQPGRRSVLVAASKHHTKIVSALQVVAGERTGPLRVELSTVAEGDTPRLELAGIGVVLGQVKDGLLVRDVIAEGGAAEAGILPGDIIVGIESKEVSDLGWDDSIQQIRGPVGSVVQLSLQRELEELELAVPRRAIRN
jgi:S1-C subfamily serine protease